jgi:hypothetical protein
MEGSVGNAASNNIANIFNPVYCQAAHRGSDVASITGRESMKALSCEELEQVSGGMRWWEGERSIWVEEVMPDGGRVNIMVDNASNYDGRNMA